MSGPQALSRAGLASLIAGPPAGDADLALQGPRARRLFWLDGVVSNVAEAFVANFVQPFALALGATTGQVGLLSSVSSLAAALGLLPGARLGETAGSRKRVVLLTGGGVGRGLLLAIAAVTFLLPPPAAVYAFIGLIALRSFVGQMGAPAWSALLADLVPLQIRGRYFSGRNIAIAVSGLLITPLAGGFIGLWEQPHGYQAGFVAAGLIGFVATVIFARIPEQRPALPDAGQQQAERGVIQLLRQHPQFAAFTAVAFLWNLSVAIGGPYFTVYLVRNLGATPGQIGILSAVTGVTAVIGQQFWGRLNDRHGAAWVMRVTGFMIPVLPLIWLVVPDVWSTAIINLGSGFLWAGYGLASFNLLLDLSPPAHRARAFAIYQGAASAAAAIGPLLGGALIAVTAIQAVFVASGAGRLIAAVLFMATIRQKKQT